MWVITKELTNTGAPLASEASDHLSRSRLNSSAYERFAGQDTTRPTARGTGVMDNDISGEQEARAL